MINIERILGSDFNDLLIGNGQANRLSGFEGDDELRGGAGGDVLEGGAGADILNGGNGRDTAEYSSSDAGINIDLTLGTATGGHAQGDTLVSIERIRGSEFNDIISGDGVNNQLFGNGGNDILSGGSGNDLIRGGAGADIIVGGTGADTADYLGSSSGVTVSLVTGTGSGGDAEGDTLVDIERIAGSNFNDILTGNDGDNKLTGYQGDDELLGGNGTDILDGGAGADILNGGDGSDTADYRTSDAAISVDLSLGTNSGGHAAGDTLTSIENIHGSNFADTLTGDAGQNNLFGNGGVDILSGGDGSDLIRGGSGADSIDGGAGTDTADYRGSDAAVTVSLLTGTGVGGHAEGDTLTGIERLFGSKHDDSLIGDNGNNVLYGFGGNDLMNGGSGNDVLRGFGGDDIMTGGQGNDRFVFSGNDWGDDTITDFGTGLDILDLRAAGVTMIDELTISQVGADTLIEFGNASITLENTLTSTIDSSDFLFA